MALQSKPFPIDAPVMPESRQIGRRSDIDRLEAGIESMTHQWIIGPRRTGKTSAAKAALARRRKAGHVALDIDLSKLDLGTAKDLAGEIARQAQAADVGAPPTTRRAFESVRRKTPQAKGLGRTLRQFGFENSGQALEAVASILAEADDGSPGLAAVLEALSVHGHATQRYVAILLDEVHLLADLQGSDREIARWCRDEAFGVVFLFAGSEESAIEELRTAGQPLAPVGREFHLGQISSPEWLRGLGERFKEVDVEIGKGELFKIIEASDGHPRRTMLIASYVHSKASIAPDRVVSPTLAQLAIHDAKKDLAWS